MLVDTILKRRRYQLLLTPVLMNFSIFSELREYIANDALLINLPGNPFNLLAVGSGEHAINLIHRPGLPFYLYTVGSGKHDTTLTHLPANPILISSLLDPTCHDVSLISPRIYPIESYSNSIPGEHLVNVEDSAKSLDIELQLFNDDMVESSVGIYAIRADFMRHIDIFSEAAYRTESVIMLETRGSRNSELITKMALTFLQRALTLRNGKKLATAISANMFLQTPFRNEIHLRRNILPTRTSAPTQFTIVYGQQLDVTAMSHIREKQFSIYTKSFNYFNSSIDISKKIKYNFNILTSSAISVYDDTNVALVSPVPVMPISKYTVPMESDITIALVPVTAADIGMTVSYIDYKIELDTFSLPRLIGDTMWIDQACEIIIDEEDLYII